MSSKGSSKSAELYSELVAWAWDEAHHASAQDVALMLSCLAEVGCQSRQLTGALAVRANAEADHFTASQMAMVWRALADLGASPPGTTVDSLLHRAASILHGSRDQNKTGPSDTRIYTRLKSLIEG